MMSYLNYIDEMKFHAEEHFPEEACGIVTDIGYQAIKNVAENPETDFKMPSDTLRKHNVLAVFHSHTNGKKHPSLEDMSNQILLDVPYGLCITNGEQTTEPVWWGDRDNIAPLKKRQFIPGIYDCYSAIRDWYHINLNVQLPEQARDDEWWLNGLDLYEDNYLKAGFKEVKDPGQVGDIALFKVLSDVMNHGAVYTGKGLIYHHLQARYSKEEPLGPWVNQVEKWIRYDL